MDKRPEKKSEETRIGFVTLGPSSGPHFNSMRLIVPNEVRWDAEVLGLYGESWEDIKGITSVIISRTSPLVAKHCWQGITLAAAIVELMNPGIRERLQEELQIPVTTALDAVVSALQVLSAKRILLITPMDEYANKLHQEYLAKIGIEAISSPLLLKNYLDAGGLSPEDVYALTKEALVVAGKVDAIYFQGAILDPIRVIDRIETEMNITVVASMPAMLWRLLSRLGLRCPMGGYGWLMRAWPNAE
ncbi:MAG: hypothetical protein BZY82_06880 [SAR202 cluster bacterium Io17-Chloro-G3]|nr:MAG: hypothetical protein BZY82_06880 [SAR202 cluster bacterium Io17-Chloro-G3]